ncbi:NAD(P)-dependent alcohol dehydrogenase [Klebsiella oxytoca]|uniref:NAD(P)-dependent alcohol dehydrogenase n=1 Tax=Klebsiella oxytoca TaxID=571 RepID=UPI001092BC17|nr:NAD(P)-dependent alcohol dehydrogenase [Klebsiella oxytoca]TGN40782.1 NAD(P)-dependent alcohol dehydrogenase [Klebsiella oxytoca]
MKKSIVSRREFIQLGMLAGSSILLSRTAFAKPSGEAPVIKGVVPLSNRGNVISAGYAAHNTSAVFSRWEFERRPIAENDILIDIKFASICHSDIHQIHGDWGNTPYPQVPGHEIAGIVVATGSKVTKFKVGDRAGVGCMVDSCMVCDSCKSGLEQHCDNNATLFTYGFPDKREPTGITQGGYANNIVVREHFAVHIPDSISLQEAAPLLCAGITTYSPLMKGYFKKGDKVGIAGIGGLGHIAVKLAVSMGAEVYAFTTTESKISSIKDMGAKEVIYVDKPDKLNQYKGILDYMISTIPYDYDLSSYASTVKPDGFFTQVGMPTNFSYNINNIALSLSRVNYNASLIGGIPETQDVVNYCAKNRVLPEIQIINANEITEAYKKVVNKEARFRFVIDSSTI